MAHASFGKNDSTCSSERMGRSYRLGHCHRPRLLEDQKTHERRHSPASKCKILLPKFNTWKQVHLEREKGSKVPLFSTVGGFFAKKHCRYGAIASPLQCNGDAISLKRQKFLAENRPKVLSKGERLPFLRRESAYKKCLREE